MNNSFICGQCGETFYTEQELPEVKDDEVILCKDCMKKMMSVVEMFNSLSGKTIH